MITFVKLARVARRDEKKPLVVVELVMNPFVE